VGCVCNGHYVGVSGLEVFVIAFALVFGVFPTYLSTFFSVAAEFILRVYVWSFAIFRQYPEIGDIYNTAIPHPPTL
jgi:hypothetical protein